MAQVLKALGDLSVGVNCRNEDFKRWKTGQERLLEEVNEYKMAKENLKRRSQRRSGDESDDALCSGFGKDYKSSGDREELVIEEEQKACFLLVADHYERWSIYGQVAETFCAPVLRISV